jgi:hypothetical protein
VGALALDGADRPRHGTAIGGISGPLLFGKLIATGKETNVFWGYLLGASLMIAAGIVQAVLGIEAARRDLEDIAKPLSAEAAEGGEQEKPRPAAARRRRFGPSESGSSYSPVQQSSSRVPDEDIDEEVAALVDALRAAGEDGLDARRSATASTAVCGALAASAMRSRPRPRAGTSAARAAGATWPRRRPR